MNKHAYDEWHKLSKKERKQLTKDYRKIPREEAAASFYGLEWNFWQIANSNADIVILSGAASLFDPMDVPPEKRQATVEAFERMAETVTKKTRRL